MEHSFYHNFVTADNEQTNADQYPYGFCFTKLKFGELNNRAHELKKCIFQLNSNYILPL